MRAGWVLALLFLPFSTALGQRASADNAAPIAAEVRKPPRLPPVVKAMPYWGEVRTERTRVLEDGTRIAETYGIRREYRDSQGRTRRDQPLYAQLPDSKDAPRIVTIDDPAAGVEYVLEPRRRIAHKFLVTAGPAERSPAETATVNETLGVQLIRGVRAEGVRRTLTIADEPRTVTIETWIASDLRIVMQEHTSDPLDGETNIQMTSLHTEEPLASLFQVPADYRMVDEAGDFTIAYPMRSHVSAPEVISRVQAKYTDDARRFGIQGVVLLSAAVDESGRARDIHVERSVEPGLDQEAIKAVRLWRFRPGEQDGHPVRVNVNVEVTFSLN